MRMNMTKRGHEAILNLVGSLTGVAWKVAEAYDLEDLEKKPAEDHFNRLLKLLDAAFEYDSRVQLPADFDRYFVTLQRRPGQTLLQYVTEHDECLRRLSDHKIDLPKAVQGWHLLRKAGLTREQKQLIMTQAPNLERIKVQEAMFLVLGQDHKAAVSDHRRPYKGKGKGRGYAAVDYETDEIEVDDEMATDSAFYEGSWDDYYEDDGTWETEEIYYENDGASFDDGASYYQQLEETAPDMPYIEEYDEAYAAYVDARKRFNDIKLSRGYLPIVALTESQANLSPGLTSPTSSPSSGKGKKVKLQCAIHQGVEASHQTHEAKLRPAWSVFGAEATTSPTCALSRRSRHQLLGPNALHQPPRAPSSMESKKVEWLSFKIEMAMKDHGPWCECFPLWIWTFSSLCW